MHLLSIKALMSGLVIATFNAAPALAEYQYINSSDKDVVYFGRKIERVDDSSVIFIKWKDAKTGKTGTFTSAYRCSKGLTDSSKDPSGWTKVRKDTIGEDWMKFACN